MILALVDEALTSGARLFKGEHLGITARMPPFDPFRGAIRRTRNL